MARVYFNVRGEGTAYCDTQDLIEGEEFTIYCIPYEGSELLDVKLWTSDDQSIAITVDPEITLTYQSIYGNIYADIYFTGSEPQPEPLFKYPWLLAKVAGKWRNYGR